MKSILHLLETIMSIPHVATDTKVRAGYLRSQLGRGHGFDLYRMFGI